MARSLERKMAAGAARAAKAALAIVMALALMVPVAALQAMGGKAYAASLGTKRLSNEGTVTYGGYSTHYFKVGDAYAYCAEPAKATPPSGSYEAVTLDEHANNLGVAKILWYGWGGPGFDKRMWPSTDPYGGQMGMNDYYALTHVLLADLYSQSGAAAVHGTDAAYKGWCYTHIFRYNHAGDGSENRMSLWKTFMNQTYWDGTEIPKDKRLKQGFMDNCFILRTGDESQNIVGFPLGGYLDIDKGSAYPKVTNGNGLYSIKGAEYTVYGDSGCTDEIEVLKVDADGHAKSNFLEAGTYYVKETKAPKGYKLNKTRYTVKVKGDGSTSHVGGEDGVTDTPLNDPAFIKLSKFDAENGWHESNAPQGGASLAGAEYTVDYYDSKYQTVDAAQASGKLKRSWVFATDEDGVIDLDYAEKYLVKGSIYTDKNNRALWPLGTYVIYETKAPAGYHISNNRYICRIEADGNSGTKITGDAFVHDANKYVGDAEQVKRGDLEFVKASEKDMSRLSNVPFNLINQSTGESHVIVTDENGYASTANSWNPHSTRTNANDAVSDGAYDTESGIWFGKDAKTGAISAVQDGKGALPYGTYTLEELRAPANEGLGLITVRDITIKRDGSTVDMGTLDDPRPGLAPSIHTTATNALTGERTVCGDGLAEINDHVEYMNLDPSKQYTLVAKLVYKDSGEDVEGASCQETFTPKSANGYQNMRIPANLLHAGEREVVVFEQLMLDGAVVADHADIEDSEQTVRVVPPEIGTSASDGEDGDKQVSRDPKATVVDEVSYRNLVPGCEYVLSGALMMKACGEDGTVHAEPIADSEGREVKGTTVFTPKEPSGVAKVLFALDTTALDHGTELVAFEELSKDEDKIAEHKDPLDEGQTVTIAEPAISTSAQDPSDGDKLIGAGPDAEIWDTVEYADLIPGREYMLECIIMARPTDGGEPYPIADREGCPITAKKAFVPKDTYGSVTVEFPLSTEGLEGCSLVAFEELFLDGTSIAEHKDIDDEGQTVGVAEPQLHTTATDAADGDKVVYEDAKAVVRDMVQYKNLVPGSAYTLTCTLMVKEARGPKGGKVAEIGEADPQKALKDRLVVVGGEGGSAGDARPYTDASGNPVTSTVEFTPQDSYGEVAVEFALDATGLEGCSLVAFEELTLGGVVVGGHKDIDDEGQTVRVDNPQIGTEASDPSDGDHVILPSKEARVKDTVSYKNLRPGREYKVKGWLMDKASGKPLTIADKRVEASATFTPNEADGEVEVEFAFDATGLAEDSRLVAFEELSFKGEVVAEHKDIDDDDQTVAVKTLAPGTGYPKTGGEWPAWLQGAALAAIYAALAALYHLAMRRRDASSI